jgi:hypothetical protein
MTDDVIADAPKTDFYLKFTDEAAMKTALSDFYQQDYITQVDDEGNKTQVADGDPYLVMQTRDYAIDIVGTMYEPTGNTLTDSEGIDYPEMAAISGWHVNMRIRGGIPNKDADDPNAENTLRDDVEALDTAHGVTPNSPSRVWL